MHIVLDRARNVGRMPWGLELALLNFDAGDMAAGDRGLAADPARRDQLRANVPVALRMLPRRYRDHLMAVYSFARTVDDIGDEAPPEQRLALQYAVAQILADAGYVLVGNTLHYPAGVKETVTEN